MASITLIGGEPEANEEISGEFVELLKQGMDAVVAVMADMWDMPHWAQDQQRSNDPEALLAYFPSTWGDLSHVPAELRVPALLICGSDDGVYDAMARAARQGDLELATVDGADHMASFMSDQARHAYLDFLRRVA